MILPLTLLTALTAVACQPRAGALSDSDAAAMSAVAAAIDRAAVVQDWDAVFALFADDAVSMSQGYPTSEGRSAIRAAVDSAMAGVRVIEHTMDLHEITGSFDVAYARGTYRQAYVADGSDHPIEVDGRLLTILRRQPDGSWLIAVWVPISDLPLPPSEGEDAEAKVPGRGSLGSSEQQSARSPPGGVSSVLALSARSPRSRQSKA